MPDWFERAFSAVTDGIASIAEDARSKLIDEGWFGRRVSERPGNWWDLGEDHSHGSAQQPDREQGQDHELGR